MWSINADEAHILEGILESLSKDGIIKASKKTLDNIAFHARAAAQKLIKAEFINRNKWTAGSIKVTPANVEPINSMWSAFGSAMPYMETQEEGGTRKPKTGAHIPLATNRVAGQGRGTRPRTKVVRKSLYVTKIKTNNDQYANLRHLPPNQQWAAILRRVRKTNSHFAYMPSRRGNAIYQIEGGRRVDMVFDLSQEQATIPKHVWMAPSAMKAIRKGDSTRGYADGLKAEIRRASKGKLKL